MIIPFGRRAFFAQVALAALAAGIAVSVLYARADLTLSHYDARGHLVVARRIFDSITPGWQQIGAVWLPLPHLLNALPVQIDAFYRTGASAVAMSTLSYAVAVAAIAWLLDRLSASKTIALAGAAVFALNPNVLYLQATPMTEPLLMALLLVGTAFQLAWLDAASGAERPAATPSGPGHDDARTRISPHAAGIVWAMACLTRYEAWPVTAAALFVSAWVLWRRQRLGDRLIPVVTIAAWPALAIAGFTVFSRIVVGSWFADDFYVPENPAQGRPYDVVAEIVWGTRMLSGYGLVAVALVGLAVLLVACLRARDRSSWLLPLALTGTAAVPFVAFYDGHPYRIRYMIPLLAVQAIAAGAALLALPRRMRSAGAAALVVLCLYELAPLDASAPMVLEAQWDRPNFAVREVVSRCLADGYDGTSIMASMGSLGHYMQDLSRHGFAIRDFLHEGNGDIWLSGLIDPAPVAGWLLIEEKAEGGDMLAHAARENPAFLRDFSRVCEGAGLALYRRHDAGSRARAE